VLEGLPVKLTYGLTAPSHNRLPRRPHPILRRCLRFIHPGAPSANVNLPVGDGSVR
jgi:hypothetical protein